MGEWPLALFCVVVVYYLYGIHDRLNRINDQLDTYLRYLAERKHKEVSG